jgi:hypothetical protein
MHWFASSLGLVLYVVLVGVCLVRWAACAFNPRHEMIGKGRIRCFLGYPVMIAAITAVYVLLLRFAK